VLTGIVVVIEPIIGFGSDICLHFTLRLKESARIAETTRGEAPMRLTVGDGTLHPGLEAVLYGMKAGDIRRFQLSPDTYGFRDPQNIHRLPRYEFTDELALEPGNVVAFDLPNGQAIPGMITAVSDAEVTVDFNHPLAGRALDFEVEILQVGRS
jgi:FKBP-type peptidyl-prolyl cis-trans isomerase SlpA